MPTSKPSYRAQDPADIKDSHFLRPVKSAAASAKPAAAPVSGHSQPEWGCGVPCQRSEEWWEAGRKDGKGTVSMYRGLSKIRLLIRRMADPSWPRFCQECPLALSAVQLGIGCLNRSQSLVASLTPSFLAGLCGNPLSPISHPNGGNDNGDDDDDNNDNTLHTAIAYTSRRDSRNFAEKTHLHANQQKTRDLFLAYLRSLSPSHQTGFAAESTKRHPPVTPREIVGRMAAENAGWLASLLIHQFVKGRSRRRRLDCLEEWLAKPGSGEDPVVRFVREADSLVLHRALVASLCSLMASIETACCSEGRLVRLVGDIERLASLARFLATLRYSVDVADSDVWIEGRLDLAIAEGHLILSVPWILAYLAAASDGFANLARFPHLQPVFGRLGVLRSQVLGQPVLNPVQLALAFILGDCPIPDSAASVLSGAGKEAIDLDPNIAVEPILHRHSPSFVALVDDVLHRLPSHEPAQPARKTRPVTEPSPDRDAIQRKLRHWFWWQWPALHNLICTLTRYLVLEESLVSDPALAKPVLAQIVPLLLPRVMASHERMVRVVVGLAVEQAMSLTPEHSE